MKRLVPVAIASAAAAAMAGQAAQKLTRRVFTPHDPPARGRTTRTHVVTVHLPATEVMPDGVLPPPLAQLHGVDVRVTPAPGDKGTEIAVTPAAASDDTDHGRIRAALRAAKMLLETGEVLQPGGPTTRPSLLNAPLRAATAHGREGGRL